MGRFGEILLIGGLTDYSLRVGRGEVVRFFLTNTANTRVFKAALPGARMKLVGGDAGRVEREQFVEEVTLGPSERAIVDVLFDASGELTLDHRTPGRTYRLAQVTVGGEQVDPPLADEFAALRTSTEMAAERERARPYLDAEPDKTIAFLAEMDMGGAAGAGHAQDEGGGDHDHEPSSSGDGIEWEDEMVEMNRMTTPANMRWKIVDRKTGAENQDIDWQFRVGELVKIRILNEVAGDHPMHHPFHVHGAGRFLVLARDGEPEPNLVWKDTVLVPTGQVVDLLLEVTNPGRWMAHCHIAEHHESGMMFSFEVDE
jgi:FtsP/CotA-like multicopper oxidase with cupredoxin domain